jgi:hypothetical protein
MTLVDKHKFQMRVQIDKIEEDKFNFDKFKEDKLMMELVLLMVNLLMRVEFDLLNIQIYHLFIVSFYL